jgi:hypothetical protein
MKNLFKQLEDWILTTQLGKFLFIMLFVIILLLIMSLFIDESIIGGIIGGGIVAIYNSFISKYKPIKFW